MGFLHGAAGAAEERLVEGKAALALAALGALVLLIIVGKSWGFDEKDDSQSTLIEQSDHGGTVDTDRGGAIDTDRPQEAGRSSLRHCSGPERRRRQRPTLPFVTTTPRR